MDSYNVYKDIAMRTNGDIYVGVVGPVRTGKSTFITKMLNSLVLPNIMDTNVKERTIDEMPQSGDGKSIMTTQPKFIPNQSVKINLKNDIEMDVRMIDCVGYLVEGALGHVENNKPRMVNTPWSEEDMSFEKAAEVGTNKVISNHSTIGVLVTTDGSFTNITRKSYETAEERVVNELKKCKKPFVIVLNSTHPAANDTIMLQNSLEKKYDVGVVTMDVNSLTEEDINTVFAKILNEFPIASVDVKMPDWMRALSFDSSIIQEVKNEIVGGLENVNKIGDLSDEMTLFANSQDFEPITNKQVVMGEGKVVFEIIPKPHLFYKVLSEQCGFDIADDYHLISYVKQLSMAKSQFDKFKDAIDQVKATGYGVVHPTLNDLKLEEPQVYKHGGKYGVKLKASAPSLHIMQVDIQTEVSPLVGSEQQSEDLVNSLMKDFENDPHGIWETKMFGKSLNLLVNEGLQNKLIAMPVEVQRKMRRTLGRIVNEGRGGVICILL